MGNPVGVDISSFQGVPDWAQVFKAGYRFAYVKTTQYPGYVNPYAIKQREEAFRHKFVVGNYCYGVATLGDALPQAHFFLSRSDIRPWHLAPFLDIEEVGSKGASPRELESFAYWWGVAVTGFLRIPYCILYTDLNMLHNRILQTRRLRDLFLLDIAYWTNGPAPKVPGWRVVFHQYNTSKGIPGFHGSVDHMRALVPLESLTIANLQTRKPPKADRAKTVKPWQRPGKWSKYL